MMTPSLERPAQTQRDEGAFQVLAEGQDLVRGRGLHRRARRHVRFHQAEGVDVDRDAAREEIPPSLVLDPLDEILQGSLSGPR